MKTIKANNGWLTQSDLKDDELRLFTDSLSMPDIADERAWMEVGDEWKERWEADHPQVMPDIDVEAPEDDITQRLEEAKSQKLAENEAYYNEHGYHLTFNGVALKLDYETRSKLRSRLEAEKSGGKATTTVWYGGHRFDLSIQQTAQMLTALELYCASAFDAYNQHKADIAQMDTADEVTQFDVSEGYPQRLAFG